MLDSGDIAVIRRHGVAVLTSSGLLIRGGPFGGRITFFQTTGSELEVFSNNLSSEGPDNSNSRPAIVLLGDRLGTAQVRELDYPASTGFSATRLRDGRSVVLGNPCAVIDVHGGRTDLPLRLANPFAAAAIGDDRYLVVAGGDVELVLVDLADGNSATLCTFKMHGSIAELVMADASQHVGYVYAHEAHPEGSLGAVVRFNFSKVDLAAVLAS